MLCRKENISKSRSKRIEQESGFSYYFARVFVIPQPANFVVPQVIGTNPLQKLNLSQDAGMAPVSNARPCRMAVTGVAISALSAPCAE